MDIVLQAFKSKTIIFSILLAVLSILQGYLQIFHLTTNGEMMVGIAIAVAVTVLRVITTLPLSEK